MTFRDRLISAIEGVSVHKSRSALTVLGVVIGITAIMVVLSVGSGAEQLIVGEIQSFGPRNIFLLPGQQPSGPIDAGGTLSNDSLTIKDYEDLQNLPHVASVVPYVFTNVTSSFESETYGGLIMGSTEGLFDVFALSVSEGRAFDDIDVASRAAVAVIGHEVKEELFGFENPLGEKIKVKNIPLTIIGVIEKKGQGSFISFDSAILSPYTVVQQSIMGIRYFHRMTIEADSVSTVPGLVQDVETLMRDNHNIDDPQKDDFFIQTQDDLVASVTMITDIVTALLFLVAAISLLVGGVGIMNVMFVSVTERTKEIGLRKALGATRNDILYQFLYEALLLTGGGGIVGIVMGAVLSFLASLALKTFADISFPFIFSLSGAVLGVVISMSIGLFFGVFPARQAAQKSPIEAIKYE